MVVRSRSEAFVMGRKRTKNAHLPPHMRLRVRRNKTHYYYDTGGVPRREIPLGPDFYVAMRRWAELEHDGREIAAHDWTFRTVAERYCREELPRKRPRTQRDYLAYLRQLLVYFDNPPAPLRAIEPQHLEQYLEWRTDDGQNATVQANRERALFSAIWSFALRKGFTDRDNPCATVPGWEEEARDTYVADDVYDAIHDAACQPVKDAMDLAYLTGMRPADVLSVVQNQIRSGALHVQPRKAQKPKSKPNKRKRKKSAQRRPVRRVRFRLIGDLAELVDRLVQHGQDAATRTLIRNEKGHTLSPAALGKRFRKARRKAAEATDDDLLRAEILDTQFRDLRAKAATDKADTEGQYQAQRFLGHASVGTTKLYLRNRLGELVDPTMQQWRNRTGAGAEKHAA